MSGARADRAIRGGIVVTEDGLAPRDVLVGDGRIAALVEPGAGSAEEEIDARGLHVLPGAVDVHVHFNEPGRTEWEGWERGTRGAAAGGVTTVVDMPLNSLPPTTTRDAFEAKREAAERAALVDFALWGGLVGDDERPLRELRDAGAVGVKAFLCDSGVPEFPRLREEQLVQTLRAAARAGVLVAVHAEDESLVRGVTDRLRGSSRRDRAAWAESRPADAEVRAVGRLVSACAASGARAHVVHVSAAEALRWRGPLSVETCPHYLCFTERDFARVGPALKCAPPIRDEANRERLWSAVLAGEIDLVASDHSPCAAAEKARGERDIFLAWGGVSGVQSLLAALLTEGVARRRMPLPLLVRLVSGAPARLAGIHPRKGALAPGSDADLALVDLGREWTLEASALQTRSGISPYLGMRFTGAIARTIVRGTTVYREGEFLAAPGYGRFVRREA